MKILVCVALLLVIGGWSEASLPVYKALGGGYGQAALELARVFIKFLTDPSRNCGNNFLRRCYHNDWKRRDGYCTGNLWNQRYSFSPWYGGKCYCCARCHPNDYDFCFWNNWKQRDRECTSRGLYGKRYSYNGPEGKRCYCCSPK